MKVRVFFGKFIAASNVDLAGLSVSAVNGDLATEVADLASGQSVAASAGSLSPFTVESGDVTLTGLSLTVAKGSLPVTKVVYIYYAYIQIPAPTDVELTLTQTDYGAAGYGALTPNFRVPLTTPALTASPGAFTSNGFSSALSGQLAQISFSVPSITIGPTLPGTLAGTGAGYLYFPGSAFNVNLQGFLMLMSDDIAFGIGGLTYPTMTAVAGSVDKEVGATITGVASSAFGGLLSQATAPGSNVNLGGAAATGIGGSVVAAEQTSIAGSFARATEGILRQGFVQFLPGLQSFAQSGFLSVSGPGGSIFESLVGLEMAVVEGNILVARTIDLSKVEYMVPVAPYRRVVKVVRGEGVET